MIRLDSVCKAYGGREVVRDLSLDVEAGSLTVLIGPSGCGKSTTLRMINRLVVPDRGRVLIGGQDVAGLPPETLRRGIGYAIQGGALFPHWTVADNIAAVPRLLRWPRARVRARVAELLALLRLPAESAGRYPDQLSGGEAQRVGVARALAADPPLLLMDEPFGAVDPPTRRSLQDSLKRIQAATGKTVVLVTHDVEEALLLADRIVLLERGRVAQQGTPRELVQHPESAFVRGFLGPRGQTGPAPETFPSDALPPGAPPACAPAPRPASLADLLG